MMTKADSLALTLEQRLEYHIAERVHQTRQKHWTLQLSCNNLPHMAAAMCLVGHIVEDLATYSIGGCLLVLPMKECFQIVTSELGGFDGCRVYYDAHKNKRVCSGKTSGEGTDACFTGHGKKHEQHATSKEKMSQRRFYQKYPRRALRMLEPRKDTLKI